MGSRVPYVFGVAAGQFFLLRASDTASERDDLRMFVTREEWVSALGSRGIKEGYVLSAPRELASSMAPAELRPWEYNCLKGLAGLKDETWATVLMLGVLVGGALAGWCSLRLGGALIVMTLIGALVGIVGDTLVFEGPAVGIIGTPICTAIAVVLGWSLRVLAKKLVSSSQRG